MILSKLQVINGGNIEISSENENDEIFLFDEIEIAYYHHEKKLVLYEDFLCEGKSITENFSTDILVRYRTQGNLFNQKNFFGFSETHSNLKLLICLVLGI